MHVIDVTEQGGDATYKKGNFVTAQKMPGGSVYLGPWIGEDDLSNPNGSFIIMMDAVEGTDFEFKDDSWANLRISYGMKDDEDFDSQGDRFLGAAMDDKGNEVHVFLKKDKQFPDAAKGL